MKQNKITDKVFQHDYFAQHLGIELVSASTGVAKVRLKIQTFHLNSANMVHGGVIFSLADLAFAVASNSYGNIALAINANIAYFKATKGGVIFATAREVAKNPKLSTFSVRVTNESDELIATFQGTAYQKKELVEDLFDDSL